MPRFIDLERYGANIVLVEEDGATLSYQDLAVLADRSAAELEERFLTATNVTPTRLLIAFRLQTNVASIACFLGLLRRGHVIWVLNATKSPTESDLLDHHRPNVLVDMSRETDTLEVLSDSLPALHPDLCLMMSTSGTTGSAKLVMLSAENVQSNAAAIQEYLDITEADRALTSLPMAYSYGLSVLNSYLNAGASLYLTERSVTEPDFWAAAEMFQVTSLAFVPHQCELIQRAGSQTKKLSNLRYITQAGGNLSADLTKYFHEISTEEGWSFYVMYGQTEASPRISYVPPERLPDHFGSIGRAIPGGELWLEDDDGNRIEAEGVAGELIYAGPNVMLGYAFDPADFAKGAQCDRLHTGDIAVRQPEGMFKIVGRKSRFVKIYGLRISLDEIEARIQQMGYSTVVTAIGETVVIVSEDDLDEVEISEALNQLYKLPPEMVYCAPNEEIARFSSGKVDFETMKASLAGKLDARASLPVRSTSISKELQRVTRARQVDQDDSFASLGGDSLGYITMSMAVEAHLGFLPDNWENMTVRELEQLEPVEGAVTKTALTSDVIARITAVSMIVVNHLTHLDVAGGTWMLLVAAGFSLQRFSSGNLLSGNLLKAAYRLLYPFLPLYYLVLAAVAVAGRYASVSMLTLTANLNLIEGKGSGLVSPNWFVSLYVQLILGVVLVFSLSRVRKWANSRPFSFAVALFSACIVMAVVTQIVFLRNITLNAGHGETISLIRLPFVCAMFVALGWLLSTIQGGRHRLLGLGAILLTVFLFPSDVISRQIGVLATGLLYLFPFKLYVPSRLGRALSQAAASSLYVYLLHGFLVHVFRYVLGLQSGYQSLAGTVVALPLMFFIANMVRIAFSVFERQVIQIFADRRRPSPA